MSPSNLSSQGPISLPNKALLVLLQDPNCNKQHKTDSELLPQLPILPNKLCLLGAWWVPFLSLFHIIAQLRAVAWTPAPVIRPSSHKNGEANKMLRNYPASGTLL